MRLIGSILKVLGLVEIETPLANALRVTLTTTQALPLLELENIRGLEFMGVEVEFVEKWDKTMKNSCT
jgi:hypothetical protein